MSQEARAVVSRAKGAPVEVATIVVPDPGPGEAVVRVQTCGVCHTDLHYREGGITDEYPFLLGHEAAGLLGWGVMAGWGAARNTGQVGRGGSVAVLGCGGVGDGAIAGAALAGATTIIAVGTDPRKLEWARGFGATRTVDATQADVV